MDAPRCAFGVIADLEGGLRIPCFSLVEDTRLEFSTRQDSCPTANSKALKVPTSVLLGLAEPQFVEFNGGFSQTQLDWFDEVLTFCDTSQEKVVVVGHIPIHPGSTESTCLAWNYKDALSVIHSHQCVVCFLAGHLHDGGYYLDSRGVHHLTWEGIIETPPTSHAFGTIYVYNDKLVVKGRGRITDKIMYYTKQ